MMKKKHIKSIIFDMGGVLLRTENAASRESIARRFGTTRQELEAFVFNSETSILSEEGKLSDVKHWHTVMRHFGQPVGDPIPLYDTYFKGDAIDQRLLEFAAALKPEYQLGLLSNAWENARVLLSERFDFLDVFDVSIFSYEAGARKPDPAIYFAILDRMDTAPEEAIFIDDVQENVDGAKAIGMQALRFTGTDVVIGRINSLLQEMK